MVMIDPSHVSPFRYEATQTLNGILGKASLRISVEDALVDKSWRKCGTSVDMTDMGDKWKEDMCRGGQHLLQETWVKATDSHYDAMIFPHLHVYGTGSLHSEPGSGGTNGIPRLARNRLLSIQASFRNNTAYTFFQLQRLITSQLFHQELLKRKQGRRPTSSDDAADPMSRIFGTVMPSNVPESTGVHF